MATKTVPGRGPVASTEGYSIIGSQAKSVALNPAGTCSGGNCFRAAGSPAWPAARVKSISAAAGHAILRIAARRIIAPRGFSRRDELYHTGGWRGLVIDGDIIRKKFVQQGDWHVMANGVHPFGDGCAAGDARHGHRPAEADWRHAS